jgi:uncharacterized protein (DUF58 family)
MVRDLENEIVTTHVVMLDVGAGMRSGALGRMPIDWACDAATAVARAAINSSDRVGLVGFDTRPIVELAADTGHHHYLQLVDRLLDTRTLVDEDLTDVTAGELVALVARYLAHQEAIDVRIKLAPPLDDPRWTSIQAGPDGQLYDVAATGRLCRRLIDVMSADKGVKSAVARANIVESDGQLAPLRQFCRMRGIELPYRTTWEHGRRAAGLAAAVERTVAHGRPDVVVLISDLTGLAEDEARAIRAIARLRKASGTIIALVPSPLAFLPQATTPHGQRVRELMARDQRAATDPGRRLFQRHGILVVEGSPFDSLERLLGGSSRVRRAG